MNWPSNLKEGEWKLFWTAWALLAFLFLGLIWGFTYFPSQDGPSHLYNAWVMRVLGRPEYPLINASYQISWRVFPNWFGQIFLAALMQFVSPFAAEKLLFSVLILGVPLAALILILTVRGSERTGSESRPPPWWSLLGFFLALNHPLHKGFENHAMGLIFFILIMAYCWRNNRDWTVPRLGGLGVLFIGCYFCHVIPFGVSLLAAAVLQTRSRTALRNLPRLLFLLLPLALAAWPWRYVRSFGSRYPVPWPDAAAVGDRVRCLLRLDYLCGYYSRDRSFDLLSILLGAAIAGTLISSFKKPRLFKARDCFFLLTVVLVAVYLLAPDRIGMGKHIAMRLSLYPLFTLLAWLEVPRVKGARLLLAAAVVILVLAHWGRTLESHRELNKRYEELACLAEKIPDHSMVRYSSHLGSRAMRHAPAYVIIGRDIVNLDNYEAELSYFPVGWKGRLEKKRPVYVLRWNGSGFILSEEEE